MMPDALPVATTILSGICTLGVGMTLAYIKDIKQNLEKLNGHVFRHEASLSRLDEHVNALESKADLAHSRLDAIKGRG